MRCGIAGEVAFHGAWADEAAVCRMTEALAAGGPDGSGMCSWGWSALGVRRWTDSISS